MSEWFVKPVSHALKRVPKVIGSDTENIKATKSKPYNSRLQEFGINCRNELDLTLT